MVQAKPSDGVQSDHGLSQRSIMDELSDPGRDAIAEFSRRFSAPAGTVLLEEGQRSDPVILVASGVVRVFKRRDDEREITLYRIGPGELCVLGIAAALAEVPYAATATAATRVEGRTVRAALMRRLFATEPALQQRIMRLVANHLARATETVVEVGFRRRDRR